MCILITIMKGVVAQLARASHWQCEGREFESHRLHQKLQACRKTGFFLCHFRGKFHLKTHFLSSKRPTGNESKSLKSPFSITFSESEGDLTPFKFTLKRQQEFAKLYTTHSCLKQTPCLYARNNFLCSSQLSGMPLRSFSRVNVSA